MFLHDVVQEIVPCLGLKCFGPKTRDDALPCEGTGLLPEDIIFFYRLIVQQPFFMAEFLLYWFRYAN